VEKGEIRQGARHLARAIRLAPLFWRPYAYLLLAVIPSRHAAGALRWMCKRAFHGIVHRKRSARIPQARTRPMSHSI
jgi:hypothetical protein